MASVPRIAAWAVRSLVGQARARGVARPRIEAPVLARDRAFAHASYWAFSFCLLLSVIAFLGALTVHVHGAWLSWVQVASGVVLLAEGLVLSRDWRGARRLLLWRLQERRKDQSTTERLSRAFLRRLLAPALGAIGVAWIGLGIVAIAFGAASLI